MHNEETSVQTDAASNIAEIGRQVNNEPVTQKKNKSSVFFILLALIAIGVSVFSAVKVFELYNKIDYNNHVVNVEAEAATPETEPGKLRIEEATLNILPDKTSMKVSGQVILEREASKNDEIFIEVSEEPEVSEEVNLSETDETAPSENTENVASEVQESEENTPTTENVDNEETADNAEAETVDETFKEKIYVPVDCMEMNIDYIQGSDTLVINDCINIKLVPTNNISAEGIAVLDTTNGTQVVTMAKKITPYTAIVGVAESNDSVKITECRLILNDIYVDANVAEEDAVQKYIIDSLPVSADWAHGFKMITSVIELNNAEGKKVYLSNFTNSITGAGIDTKATLTDTAVAKYNKTIKDSKTGYIPFIYDHADGRIKILATSTDELRTIFNSATLVEEAK